MCAKGPRQNNPVNGFDLHFVHEQPKTGIKSGLGKLDRAHIVLGDRHILGNVIAEGPAIRLDAG